MTRINCDVSRRAPVGSTPSLVVIVAGLVVSSGSPSTRASAPQTKPKEVIELEKLLGPLKEITSKETKDALDRLLDEADRNSRRVLPATEAAAMPALHRASGLGEVAKVVVLLSQGDDVNSRYRNGYTSLRVAALYNQPAVVEVLLDHGADVNARDNFDQTALHVAASERAVPVVSLLLARGADVNARKFDGETSLMIAATRNDLDTVLLLLARGADPNIRADEGASPLHQAYLISGL
jgi:hypothetical protein